MTNEELEKLLKEQLLTIWKNNAIFRDNIKYLTQVHLRSLPNQMLLNTLENVEDLYYYELQKESTPPRPRPHLLNNDESLDLLFENPKSFCRLGDGEYELIMGRSIPFQTYDKNLSSRLKEIVASSDDKCYVGITQQIFESTRNFSKPRQDFWRLRAKNYRKMLLGIINPKKLYISATVILGFPEAVELAGTVQDKLNYFDKIKNLFAGRKLVIFCGETVFDKITHDVFEKAQSKTFVKCASKNAWSQYDKIMERAKTFPKDCTLCFILGPTATVLAYDLAQEGYMAWDIGHVAKWYDVFLKEGGIKDNGNFFAPD